jgi:hypothetical protein
MQELEEEIEEPITDPTEIVKYTDFSKIYEFQKFPNLGRYKKFDSPIITNYVIFGKYDKTTQEFEDGGAIPVKQMERWIKRKQLVKIQ